MQYTCHTTQLIVQPPRLQAGSKELRQEKARHVKHIINPSYFRKTPLTVTEEKK